MNVDEVELRVIRLPYKSVFKTSFAAESEKVAVIASTVPPTEVACAMTDD